MGIGNVSGVSGNAVAKALQSTPEAAEVTKGGRDNDGDADDAGASAVASTPSTTVNMSGQKLGQVINVKA